MLIVKTKLSKSNIHGIGLFADQDIPKGTLVQKFIDGFDLIVQPNQLIDASDEGKKQFLKYSYHHKISGNYILNCDDARFLNHSFHPNLIADPDGGENDVAARDIKAGEELTVNYENFDADYTLKMNG